MVEYIERNALIAEFKRLTLGENSLVERLFADGVYAVIETFPAADVAEVRHGRWIELSRSSKCSECEFETGRYEPARKFCPACGALMDGEETTTCHDGVCEIPGVEQKEGNHVE